MNDENDQETQFDENDADPTPPKAQQDSGAEPEAGELGEDGEPAGDQPEAGEPEDPLAAAQAEAASWKDRCLRTAADFDNFRKRSRRDVSDAYRSGREDMFRDLLTVFDNLERAVAHAENATEVKALADGIQMVMRLFFDTISRMGIERIEAVGRPFDPALHEAIQHMPTNEHPPGAVAAEVQPGYRMADRLVRPSMVVVAKATQAETDDAAVPDQGDESADAAAPGQGEDTE